MTPRNLAVKIIQRFDQTEAYIDKITMSELSKFSLSTPDKNLIHEIVNGTIRWRGYLDWILQQLYQGKFRKCPLRIKIILEIALYQMLYLDRIPDRAALFESVTLAKKSNGEYWGKKVNAILRTFQRNRNALILPDFHTQTAQHIAVKYSHPLWMVERWLKRFGVDETVALCQANNRTPQISLRTNQTKTDAVKLRAILKDAQVESTTSARLSGFIIADSIPDLSQFAPFQDGLFTVQDVSAGLVAHLVDPKPGEIIIDLCAAPGGKSTHIAERAKNLSFIYAIDKHFHRLLLVRENIERLDLAHIQLINADASRFAGPYADKVLIDAPCSGLGVLAKRPDLRWKRTLKHINELVDIQQSILTNAASLVKKGGALIYSTCTIESEENEQVIERFLSDHPGFIIDPPGKYVPGDCIHENKYIYTFPQRHFMDGSFAVRLIKN